MEGDWLSQVECTANPRLFTMADSTPGRSLLRLHRPTALRIFSAYCPNFEQVLIERLLIIVIFDRFCRLNPVALPDEVD